MRFKIQFDSAGSRWGLEYRNSIQGAIKVATSKGWRGQPGNPDKHYDHRPTRVMIFARRSQRISDHDWDLIAHVDARGIRPVSHEDWASVRVMQRRVTELTKQIAEAQLIELELRSAAKAMAEEEVAS